MSQQIRKNEAERIGENDHIQHHDKDHVHDKDPKKVISHHDKEVIVHDKDPKKDVVMGETRGPGGQVETLGEEGKICKKERHPMHHEGLKEVKEGFKEMGRELKGLLVGNPKKYKKAPTDGNYVCPDCDHSWKDGEDLRDHVPHSHHVIDKNGDKRQKTGGSDSSHADHVRPAESVQAEHAGAIPPSDRVHADPVVVKDGEKHHAHAGHVPAVVVLKDGEKHHAHAGHAPAVAPLKEGEKVHPVVAAPVKEGEKVHLVADSLPKHEKHHAYESSKATTKGPTVVEGERRAAKA